MDGLPKRRGLGKEDELSDEEKLEKAIKRKKLEKARKAVNNSFDRSVGAFKKRQKKGKKSHTQSFVLRQASALERKNKDIVSALVKMRQYTSQLERLNLRYREQEVILGMKLLSYEKKLKDVTGKCDHIQKKLTAKEGLLGNVQNQLSTLLTALQLDCEDLDSKHLENSISTSTRQPLRIPKNPQDSDSTSSSSGSEDEEPQGFEDAKACGGVKNRSMMSRSRSLSPLSNMSALQEDSDPSEEEQEQVFSPKPATSMQQNVSKLVEQTKCGDVTMPFTSGDEIRRRPSKRLTRNTNNQTFADLNLHVSFSSEDGEKSDDAMSADEHVEKQDETRKKDDSVDNVTTYSSVSMDLTAANTDNATIEITQEHMTEKCNGQNRNDSSKKTLERPKKKTAARKSRAALEDKTNKPVKERTKRKQMQNSEQNSVYDFLSCSGDSFVRDPSKGVKLNSSRSFSPIRVQSTMTNHRHSEPGAENEEPSRRPSRRRGAVVSYAEPSLNSKLRRGDQIADGSLYNTFSPRKKQRTDKRAKSK